MGFWEREGQHGQQPEHEYGVGLVLVDVVGMPAIAGFVESLIFDTPATVPYLKSPHPLGP